MTNAEFREMLEDTTAKYALECGLVIGRLAALGKTDLGLNDDGR